MSSKISSVQNHGYANIPKVKTKQDEAIIGTNDYSIVSKRSVEKLYLQDEPEFLRPFVSKFKRRAPLINRGYWLRMKAIESIVKQFLDKRTSKSKVVVNLGCGFEPLPFRMIWKYGTKIRDTRFVDIDFPQLIQKKVQIIRNESVFTDQLHGLHNASILPDAGHIYLDHPRYCAVGCDLGDRGRLKDILWNELKLNENAILFIGEVSIVYMHTNDATELIRICGAFDNARFCLLEQHLPAGENHPFAKTMIDHFNKQTPLRGLSTFSTIKQQRLRFSNAGWYSVHMTDLWSLWQHPEFLSKVERETLDTVEPFDEWEELALFAGHYFLLVATTSGASESIPEWAEQYNNMTVSKGPNSPSWRNYTVLPQPIPRGYGRRFGAILDINDDTIAFHGGTANMARQGVSDIYTVSEDRSAQACLPENLSCHTITPLGDDRLLLGGRTSPPKASRKCWTRIDEQWVPSQDLEPGRYRHCAVSLQLEPRPAVLTFGGKTSAGKVLGLWSLFDEQFGWQELDVEGACPPALFGAAMATTGFNSGILVGGMSQAGLLACDPNNPGFWRWSMESKDDGKRRMRLFFVPASFPDATIAQSLRRFGAAAISLGADMLLIGGIGPQGPLQVDEEIVLVRSDGGVEHCSVHLPQGFQRPMLSGFGVKLLKHDSVLIIGGGGVCFSFGACWNDHSYLLCAEANVGSSPRWRFVSSTESDPASGSISSRTIEHTEPTIKIRQRSQQVKDHTKLCQSHGKQIHRTNISTPSDFERILSESQPALIQGLELGPSTKLWTAEYLKVKIGVDHPTIVHSASNPQMSFRDKNFSYETISFGLLIDQAMTGAYLYMRALSISTPSKKPANLRIDYPAIADDFQTPQALKFVQENEHSSVLRITGNVTMWLHYDVMANVLCQIRGSKRIILFPLVDISHLQFPPGETTSNLDVFSASEDILENTNPIETVLNPGDVLFIPPCWPHTTAPVDEGGSVAVNVFFRSFEQKMYASGRDVYGNRDLEMYQNGRKHVERIVRSLEGMLEEDRVEKVFVLAQTLRTGKRLEQVTNGSKEVERILRSAKDLPDGIAGFYLARLADELMSLGIPEKNVGSL